MDVQKHRVGILIVLIIGLCGCRDRGPDYYQGYVEGDFTYIGTVASGVLRECYVYRGAKIKKGDLLYRLDPQPEAAQLAQAKQQLESANQELQDILLGQRSTILEGIQAQLDKSKADLELASINLKRQCALYQRHVIAKATLDEATADYKSKKNIVEQEQANLNEAKLGGRQHAIQVKVADVGAAKERVNELEWGLEQKSVYAPITGHVFDTYYYIGEFVKSGAAVLSMLSPQDIKLVFFVPEPILSKIQRGQTVSFKCDSCSKHQTATISFISDRAEYTPPVIYSEKTRSKLMFRIEARMKLSIAEQYHPGQPIEVRLNGTK